jgi:hypothetical protein
LSSNYSIISNKDISFTSEEDENELDLMEQSFCNLNAVVAKAAIEVIDNVYDEEEQKKRGGSLPVKAPNKDRDFESAYHCVLHGYF